MMVDGRRWSGRWLAVATAPIQRIRTVKHAGLTVKRIGRGRQWVGLDVDLDLTRRDGLVEGTVPLP
jgi:hypothetical protein